MSLCILVQSFDYFALMTPLAIAPPKKVTFGQGEFWATQVDWSVDRTLFAKPGVAELSKSITTLYVGPFSSTQPRVVGLDGSGWVDLNSDVTFVESSAGTWISDWFEFASIDALAASIEHNATTTADGGSCDE
jgi:hypothetical protein